MYVVSVATYGIAPIGTSQTEVKDSVLMTSLTIVSVSYYEIDNLWIGPKQVGIYSYIIIIVYDLMMNTVYLTSLLYFFIGKVLYFC